jgi:hypothetical protein
MISSPSCARARKEFQIVMRFHGRTALSRIHRMLEVYTIGHVEISFIPPRGKRDRAFCCPKMIDNSAPLEGT